MRPKLMDWEGERLPKIDEIWMLARIKNSLKNRWLWRPKLKNIMKKNASKNDVFFACVFKWILESFGEGFGRVLGGFGDSFLKIFHFFLKNCDFAKTSKKTGFYSVL